MKLNYRLLKAINIINKEIEEKNSTQCLLVSLSNDFPPVLCIKVSLSLSELDSNYSIIDIWVSENTLDSLSNYLKKKLSHGSSNPQNYQLYIIDNNSDLILKSIDFKNSNIRKIIRIEDNIYQITLRCEAISF